MCCPCMIATIPLTTGNKLNCFISAREMLTIIWRSAFFCFFYADFYILLNHLFKINKIMWVSGKKVTCNGVSKKCQRKRVA